MKKKQKHAFIRRFGNNTGGWVLHHYYDENILDDLKATPHYDWDTRYIWFRYTDKHPHWATLTAFGWALSLVETGTFKDGCGWYAFMQTGPKGLHSPFVTSVIKCRGRNESYKIAMRWANDGVKIEGDQLDIMRARFNLLGA